MVAADATLAGRACPAAHHHLGVGDRLARSLIHDMPVDPARRDRDLQLDPPVPKDRHGDQGDLAFAGKREAQGRRDHPGRYVLDLERAVVVCLTPLSSQAYPHAGDGLPSPRDPPRDRRHRPSHPPIEHGLGCLHRDRAEVLALPARGVVPKLADSGPQALQAGRPVLAQGRIEVADLGPRGGDAPGAYRPGVVANRHGEHGPSLQPHIEVRHCRTSHEACGNSGR